MLVAGIVVALTVLLPFLGVVIWAAIGFGRPPPAGFGS